MHAALLALAVASPQKEPLYPHLAAEINAMAKVDQQVRQKLIDQGVFSKPTPDGFKEMMEIDHRDTERMKWIVKEFGWPTPEMVGREASANAWLLVQHADADLPFQQRCLELIEPLARTHVIPGSNYVYLFDRVRVNTGRIQRFGTLGKDQGGVVWIQPVEDPKRVDAWRKQYGLEPLEEYAKGLAQVMKEKLAPDWRERLNPPPPKRH